MAGQMNERQAALERERGSFESARASEAGMKTIGGQVAAFAANGIAPSAGTALETVKQAGENAALDVAAIRYGASIESTNQHLIANIHNYNAQSAQSAAAFAFLSPVIGAFSSFGTKLGGSFGGLSPAIDQTG